MKYIRYAEDFIIGVKGDRTDCERIKQQFSEFISEKLKMELSEEKTLITHSSQHARFLGYAVRVCGRGNMRGTRLIRILQPAAGEKCETAAQARTHIAEACQIPAENGRIFTETRYYAGYYQPLYEARHIIRERSQ